MAEDTASSASRREYAQRLNRVLDLIDQRLSEPLELATLAQAAHFSPFHFHRVFAAWMGETLGDYLRRRRLEVAAQRLTADLHTPVLTVALEVGFGSGEGFARAFKERFDCTPTQWRAGARERWAQQLADSRTQHRNLDQAPRKHDQAGSNARADDDNSTHPFQEITMDVQILTLPAARIAYLRHIGPYGPALGKFWGMQVMPWLVANGLLGRVSYGIGHDDPSITEPSKCRYDAGVEVEPDFQPSGKASITSLPGGRYAVAQFSGMPGNLSTAWTEIFRDWLPGSGMQTDARPCFERYPAKGAVDLKTGRLSCEICVPVKPL
ncbi:MAG: AraC family transcriptional regulator [Burkholderiaceae bacterium]